MKITYPYNDLLNRDSVKKEVEKYIPEQIELLKQLVDYGTHLIIRTFVSSKRNLESIVIISVLLKQFVTLLDSIHILLSNGATIASHLPSRSLFECTLYITWMLENKTTTRTQQYYVWEKRRKLEFLRSFVKGTVEHKKFSKAIKKYEHSLQEQFKTYEKSAINEIKDINNLLQSKKYNELNLQFENLEKKRYIKWYQPNGPNSIKDLSYRLNYQAEYEIIYTTFSKITHSNVLSDQIKVQNNKVIFENIRSLNESQTVLLIVLSLTMDIYMKILKKYRPEELVNFRKTYKIDWRNAFQSIKKINYDLELHEI